MPTPRVSICLPTWNGERDLERLLPALAAQEVEGGSEIVAIDSSSRDGTRDLLGRFGARVETIRASEFRHGATRNRIAALAAGEVLVFLSQDALPRDRTTIAELARAFDDPRTAGASARVLPHEDDDALTARTVLDAPESAGTACVFELADGRGADARGRLESLRFNDVASALRASVWRTLPFPDVEFGEDRAWAERALELGHRIRFVPAAVVLHAHRYTPRAAFERYRVDAAFHARVRGVRLRPSLWSVARGLAHELRADWRFVRRERRPLAELWRAPALRGAQVWGQYLGSRSPS